MKNKIRTFILLLITLFVAFAIVGSRYYHNEYPRQDFDVILFTITAGVENTSSSVIQSIIKSCIASLIALWIILFIPTITNIKNGVYLRIHRKKSGKEKIIQLFPIKFTSKHSILYSTFILFIAFTVFVKSFGIDEYLRNQMQDSTLFEEYYVDARKVGIEFPETKRNLIFILGESFENTVLSRENGGAWDYSLMPELEQLALNNTSFSNTQQLGGPYAIYGADYSAAGNIAMTSGVPLKLTDISKNPESIHASDSFMSGVYSLGEVLSDNGYNLEIIMGSDGTFGNRKQYYECNGHYKIFDLNYAISTGKMTEADKVWWGFSDDDLYSWSKDEILNLASQDKPFNYILVTADTHFTDGYLSPYAEKKYSSQYENVHAYASKLANDFIDWVKTQDFYENTTIVIVGDHLGMQNNFYSDKIQGDYSRTIYNVFINDVLEPTNNHNRTFTSYDIYPTILASIGVKIEGNRLGLGTNLYSDIPTIPEELGIENFNNELKKNSKYYNEQIMGDEYYKYKKEYSNS